MVFPGDDILAKEIRINQLTSTHLLVITPIAMFSLHPPRKGEGSLV